MVSPDDWVPPVLNRSKPSWLSSSVRIHKIVESGIVPFPLTSDKLNHLLFCSRLLKDIEDDPEVKATRARVQERAKESSSSSSPSSSLLLPSPSSPDTAAAADASSSSSSSDAPGDSSSPAIPDESVLAFLDSLKGLLSLLSSSYVTPGYGSRVPPPPSSASAADARSIFDCHLSSSRILLNAARPNAAHWHQHRRNSLLKSHGSRLRRIISPGGGSHQEGTEGRGDHEVTVLAVAAICVGHVLLAVHCASSWSLVLLLSSTFGSFFAFGFQSMNHILMHSSLPLSVSKPLALVASALGPMPWYSYYMSGGHARHHHLAGTERDIDREALFWIWERVPHKSLDTPLGSVAWASTAALLLPFAYMYSLLTCAYHNYRQNEVELFHFLTESFFKVTFFTLCCYFGNGFKTFAYLCLSGGFSVGLLCHPYLSFWILQHSCAVDPDSPSKSQPTVSYYGSSLWNWANYNILLHVEHHDFARMPWHRVQELRREFPEYYKNLRSCNSCLKLIYTWIHAKGDKLDFCCEHCFGQDFVKNL